MVIDAGSGGSRLHIYAWEPVRTFSLFACNSCSLLFVHSGDYPVVLQRIFTTIPPNISFPTTDEKWTERMAPGVSTYVSDPEAVSNHLIPLIEVGRIGALSLSLSLCSWPKA